MDKALGNRIIDLRQRIVANFNAGHWEEIGLLTGHSEIITGYPRLLRSLNWNDEDYAGNVLGVLRLIADQDPKALRTIEKFVDERFPGESEYVSASLQSGRSRSLPTYSKSRSSRSSLTWWL